MPANEIRWTGGNLFEVATFLGGLPALRWVGVATPDSGYPVGALVLDSPGSATIRVCRFGDYVTREADGGFSVRAGV